MIFISSRLYTKIVYIIEIMIMKRIWSINSWTIISQSYTLSISRINNTDGKIVHQRYEFIWSSILIKNRFYIILHNNLNIWYELEYEEGSKIVRIGKFSYNLWVKISRRSRVFWKIMELICISYHYDNESKFLRYVYLYRYRESSSWDHGKKSKKKTTEKWFIYMM